MKQILLVGFGGFMGSILRYLISKLNTEISIHSFPAGTFLVNIIGSLLIGFLVGMLATHAPSSQLRLLLITGFCGGFTTFSAFTNENFNLIANGEYLTSALYILLSIIGGIFAVFGGIHISKLI